MSDSLQPHGCSTSGFPVLHYLPGLLQTHVHWVGDAIQPSCLFLLSTTILPTPRIIFHVIVKVTQPCPTLWDPMDCIVHGILQARILEWAAFPFSRGSSQPRDRTQVSHIAGGFFTSWATRLVPWPGIEPEPPALEGEVLSTGLPGKSPKIIYLNVKKDKEICHTLVIPGNMTSGYKW